MDYAARLTRTQEMLKKRRKTLLLEDPISLLYLTGLQVSAGKILITDETAVLLLDKRYTEMGNSQKLYPVIHLEADSLKETIADLGTKDLLIAKENTTLARFEQLKKQLFSCQLCLIDNPVTEQRLIKDAEELESLRQAADLGSQGFDVICQLLREGISEQAVALELEIFWRREARARAAFDPIIAFGSSSSMPHYHTGDVKLRRDQPILIDIGVTLGGYHSDMTRVVFLDSPTSEMEEIYHIVKKAQELALARCKPGALIAEVDGAARDYIKTTGYGDKFSHGLGHGLGLEVHEAPHLNNTGIGAKKPLQPNMVITIEPGIYLPGLGGVRIEDTIAITETGYENFTKRSTKLKQLDSTK